MGSESAKLVVGWAEAVGLSVDYPYGANSPAHYKKEEVRSQ